MNCRNGEMIRFRRACLISLILLWVFALFSRGVGRVSAQTGSWSEAVNISNTSRNAWFPDLAVDGLGRVHVVWCESWDSPDGAAPDQVNYVIWDGQTWSKPNDIIPESDYIHRPTIAVGPTGDLLMVFREEIVGGTAFFFTAAQASNARSAAAWSSPQLLSVRLHNYIADLAVDTQGTMHLVFDDAGDPDSEVCPGCADTYYRRSMDNGRTWSAPVNLHRTPTGSGKEQIEIDPSGVIHIVWGEGWDRLTAQQTEPIYGGYVFSSDGGLSWSTPLAISYPTPNVAQLTVGADGQGGVMLVWRTTIHDEIFYQWSTDHAGTWSPPRTIPGIFARPWTILYDMYDMATDSAGHIHLLAVGRDRLKQDAPLGMYHLVWDGGSWSNPVRVFLGEGYPEYPTIVVSQGDRLHAVWFVRDVLWGLSNYQVWYSDTQVEAPHQAPPPTLTPVPMPTLSPTPSSISTATPYPTLDLGGSGLPDDLYTESDEAFRLAIALSPVALMALVVIAIRKGWFHKLQR